MPVTIFRASLQQAATLSVMEIESEKPAMTAFVDAIAGMMFFTTPWVRE